MDIESESVTDFAINLFKKNFEEINEENVDTLNLEDTDFPHWNQILEKVNNLWSKNYHDHLVYKISENETASHINKFKAEANRIFSKRSEYHSFKKYYDYVVEYQVNKIRNDLHDRITDQKENICHKAKVVVKPLDRKIVQELSSKSKRIAIESLTAFELAHMLRGHSKDNNIEDSSTTVNDAAFEIAELTGKLDAMHSYTNICATCGNNIINLIDVESGKIVKRFVDEMVFNRSKEVYNRLAWTVINDLSILVAGGLHGQIKVILPKHSVMLSRIDAHTSQIKCLLFHYRYTNILFSASNDGKINVWRICINEGNTDMECECSNELIGVIEYGDENRNQKESVLSMCFALNDYLIIATECNNYYVKLNESVLLIKNETNERIDVDMSNQEAINFLTSVPEDRKRKKAQS